MELFALLFGNVMQRMFHNTNNGKNSFYKLCTTIKLSITDLCIKLSAIIKEFEGTIDFDTDGSAVIF